MANTLDADIGTLQILAESSVIAETGQDLIDKVRRKIDDSSYEAQTILDMFTQCLVDLAGEFLLPELEAHATLATDPDGLSPYIRMPADFHHSLRACYSEDRRRPVTVYGSHQLLARQFRIRNQSGPVVGVAGKGRWLYYQRVPASAETLTIEYYRYPERLLTRAQKPECLPPHFVEPLLVAYACKEIFAEIEDGIEGPQVNTDRWEGRYEAAKQKLEEFLGPEEREPVEITEEIDWDRMAYS
jgi:hypothetical protein